MPDHLVDRINASLTAAQDQRAAGVSNPSVTPLLGRARRRSGRFVLAIAATAAAVAMVAVAGGDVFKVSQPTAESGGSAIASTTGTGAALRGQAPGLDGQAAKQSGQSPASPVQIVTSGTRYTEAAFVTQARTLRGATAASQRSAVSGVGPAGTAPGLPGCLRAIGAAGAQVVRADVAFYQGRPAVIIVATTRGASMAYVVGLRCSATDAAVLRPGTPLP